MKIFRLSEKVQRESKLNTWEARLQTSMSFHYFEIMMFWEPLSKSKKLEQYSYISTKKRVWMKSDNYKILKSALPCVDRSKDVIILCSADPLVFASVYNIF